MPYNIFLSSNSKIIPKIIDSNIIATNTIIFNPFFLVVAFFATARFISKCSSHFRCL